MNYLIILRGINVGGNKKVPMAELKELFARIGYPGAQTLLASGNIIFSSKKKVDLQRIEQEFEKHFGFTSVMTLRTEEEINKVLEDNLLSGVAEAKSIKKYITFIDSKAVQQNIDDLNSLAEGVKVVSKPGQDIYWYLDSEMVPKTVKIMEALDRIFGKIITTRNLNTVQKISNLIQKL